MRLRAAKLWTLLFACMLAIYSIGYKKSWWHPPLDHAFKHPREAVIYYLNLLGGALDDGFYAKKFGLAGIFLFLTVFSFWRKKSFPRKHGLSLYRPALIHS